MSTKCTARSLFQTCDYHETRMICLCVLASCIAVSAGQRKSGTLGVQALNVRYAEKRMKKWSSREFDTDLDEGQCREWKLVFVYVLSFKWLFTMLVLTTSTCDGLQQDTNTSGYKRQTAVRVQVFCLPLFLHSVLRHKTWWSEIDDDFRWQNHHKTRFRPGRGADGCFHLLRFGTWRRIHVQSVHRRHRLPIGRSCQSENFVEPERSARYSTLLRSISPTHWSQNYGATCTSR